MTGRSYSWGTFPDAGIDPINVRCLAGKRHSLKQADAWKGFGVRSRTAMIPMLAVEWFVRMGAVVEMRVLFRCRLVWW